MTPNEQGDKPNHCAPSRGLLMPSSACVCENRGSALACFMVMLSAYELMHTHPMFTPNVRVSRRTREKPYIRVAHNRGAKKTKTPSTMNLVTLLLKFAATTSPKPLRTTARSLARHWKRRNKDNGGVKVQCGDTSSTMERLFQRRVFGDMTLRQRTLKG